MWFLVIVGGLIVVYLIAFVVAGGYITSVSANVKSISGYDSNQNLQNAFNYSTTSAVIVWILVGLAIIVIIAIIILVIVGLFTGVEEIGAAEGAAAAKEGGGGFFKKIMRIGLILLLGAMILLNITVGVLSVLTATNLNSARQDIDSDNLDDLYNDAIIASSITLGTVGLLILAFIFKFIHHRRQEKKKKEAIQKKAVIKHNREVEKKKEREEELQILKAKKHPDLD